MTKAAPHTLVSFEDTAIAFESKTDKDLAFSIFIFRMMGNEKMVKFLTSLTKLALALRLPIDPFVKATIFRQFCGGVSLEDCDLTIDMMGKSKIGAILDYSIEGQSTEASFDAASEVFLRIIDKAKDNPNIPVCCMKPTAIARFELLEKVSTGEELSAAEKQEYAQVVKRLDTICRAAYNADTPMYIDAEETWIQDAVDRLAETMMRRYNQSKAIIFTTLQMYRWDRLDYLKKLLQSAQREGFKLGVKFVRGAYMEKERKRAQSNGYKDPIQPNKAATDNDYDAAIELSVQHLDFIEICCGTHNEQSCMKLVHLMHENRIPHNHPSIYFSQLYGMSDHISYNLSHAGYNVSKYLPYGPIKDTLPYLIRRAEENTAVAGQMGQELRLLTNEKKRREAMI